jgi:hypothetical protein
VASLSNSKESEGKSGNILPSSQKNYIWAVEKFFAF